MRELAEKVMKQLDEITYKEHVEFLTSLINMSKEKLSQVATDMKSRSEGLAADSAALLDYLNTQLK